MYHIKVEGKEQNGLGWTRLRERLRGKVGGGTPKDQRDTYGGGTRKEALNQGQNPPTLKCISSTNTTSINNLMSLM
jgi:hypothetical protein